MPTPASLADCTARSVGRYPDESSPAIIVSPPGPVCLTLGEQTAWRHGKSVPTWACQCVVSRPYPSLGSNASRRALPSRLDARTVTKIQTPGRKTSHGECAKYCCALLSMLPQLGVGG